MEVDRVTKNFSKKLLIFGTGRFALRHLENARLMDIGASIVSLSKRRFDENRCIDLSDVAYSEFAGLVASSSPQANKDVMRIASRVGLPLFIEKPIIPDQESIDLLDELGAKGVPVLFGYQDLFDLTFIKAVTDIVESQEGSGAFHISLGHDVRQWRDLKRGSYSFDSDQGGALKDLSHAYFFAERVFGTFDSVETVSLKSRLGNFSDVEMASDSIVKNSTNWVGVISQEYFSPRREFSLVVKKLGWRLTLDLNSGMANIESSDSSKTIKLKRIPRDDLFKIELKTFWEVCQSNGRVSYSPEWGAARSEIKKWMKNLVLLSL